MGIAGWQFAQIESTLVEVRYMRQAALSTKQRDQAGEDLRRHFDNAFNLSFVHVAELKETSSGKFIQFVNEYSKQR